MPFLDVSVARALRGATVRMATLVELRFASKTMRLWNGAARISAAGETWDGIGKMGSIDGLTQTREPVSHKVTMKLTGVTPEMLALALNSTTDVQGRLAFVWLQLFDTDWQPVEARVPIFWGVMQRLVIMRREATGLDGGSRVCELEVENVFANRSRPPAFRYTDTDQQARSPGDRFCRFVPLQRNQTIIWPDY